MQVRAMSRLTAALVALIAAAAVTLNYLTGLGPFRDPQHLWLVAWSQLRFFTVLTCILVAVTFARIARGWAPPPGVAGGLALWAAFVGLVYHVLLGRNLFGLDWWVDHLLHTATPVATLCWWLAFAPRAGLRPLHAVAWLGWPLAYVAYALGRGALDGQYPYFFVNPTEVGWGGVALWTLALGATFLAGGLALVSLGRLLPQRFSTST